MHIFELATGVSESIVSSVAGGRGMKRLPKESGCAVVGGVATISLQVGGGL